MTPYYEKDGQIITSGDLEGDYGNKTEAEKEYPIKEISEFLRSIPRKYKPKVNKKTERGELLNFFALETERPITIIAVRLSHYSKSDLYGLKSAYLDRKGRNGLVSAHKYFWWITKKVLDRK